MASDLTLSPAQQRVIDEQAVKMVEYRRGIRRFIFDMWGLVPQPVKPEYQKEWEDVCRASGRNWETAKKRVTGAWFGDPVDPKRPDLEWRWHDFQKGTHFTWQQNLILIGIEKAVAGEAKRLISVVSGHGIGKSATCSWIILWFLYCYQGAQVPVTAPTSHQMHDVLWKELSIWIKRMPDAMQPIYEWTSDYIRIAYDPEAWFARARTSTKENTEAIAGVHGDHVAVVGDEASGIPQQVFDTAEGALTSGNVFVFLISNGTQTTGYFHATQHQQAYDWQTFRFNGEESPIVDRSFIALKAKHGFDSDEYRIRVRGGFPKETAMDLSGYLQLIPREKIGIRVMPEGLRMPFMGRRVLGVDPAGEGKDRATFVVRDRFKAELVAELPTSNDKMIAEMTLSLMSEYKVLPEDVVIGAFGTGADVGKLIALATAEGGKPYDVYTVLEGNRPEQEEQYNGHRFQRLPEELTNPDERPEEWIDLYLNMRALMYFRAARWLVQGGQFTDSSVDNSAFASEMVMIRYKRTLTGNRIQLMSKKDMLKLGIPSPNIADAFALTHLRMLDDEPQSESDRAAALEDEAMPDEERFNAI